MNDEKTEGLTSTPSGGPASAVPRIARGSDLYDVRTIATFARLHEEAPEIGVPLTCALDINLQSQIDQGEFRIIGKFALSAHEEGKTRHQSFFSARLHVVAYYRLHAGEQILQEELEAFAHSNGMIHLWPYFRSFVQQSCGQFAIPPIVLAPFRVKSQ
jgi:preprotein translocase subunit SecB